MVTTEGRRAEAGSPYLPDTSFDRFVRMVRRAVDVPVALVSFVEPDRQRFVGAVGLPEPYQTSRETPLSHSFCQYVVADSAPLVVADAREDARLCDNLAIPDLGVVAYAGFPVTDHLGTVVGSLCAIDGHAREWAPDELAALEDLAAACSAELSQRRLRDLADERFEEAVRAGAQSQLLLRLSESLSATRTLAEVVRATAESADTGLGCVRAGIWLRPTADVLDVPDEGEDAGPVAPEPLRLVDDEQHAVLPADGSNPQGRVVLSGEPLHVADDGTEGARAYLPLTAGGSTYGVLDLVWETPRVVDADVRAVTAALASYCALAVQRALLLEERIDVGSVLQRALLPQVPEVAGVRLVPLYRPAAVRNEVGGDWFDAQELPDGSLDVVVGDVVGHDIAAAADMGRVRTILRTLVWDRPGSTPAEVLRQLDRALSDLGVARMATLVHGRLAPPVAAGNRRWEWTNAGHLPPLLVPPGGPARYLVAEQRDLMLGVVRDTTRSTHAVDLAPGSVLVLFSDGLVESRSRRLAAGLDELLVVVERHRHLEPAGLVQAVADEMLSAAPQDDVVVLAVATDV
ncbi:hypothetical protein GCM10028777_02100 [Angustibacter speluncae]